MPFCFFRQYACRAVHGVDVADDDIFRLRPTNPVIGNFAAQTLLASARIARVTDAKEGVSLSWMDADLFLYVVNHITQRRRLGPCLLPSGF